MNMTAWLLDIKVSYNKTVILITIYKNVFVNHTALIFSLVTTAFCQAITILTDFWFGILNSNNVRHLKKS